jgi:hypothetical protein
VSLTVKQLLNIKPQVTYKDQTLEYDQLQGVAHRAEVLLSGDCKAIKTQSILNPDVTWEEAKEFYNSLSRKDQGMVRKSGQQLEQGWYNPTTGKLDIPGSKPTKERGILICQMYLQQGALCAYSGDGPCHILDFQVEHIVPENGDFPHNIVLALANVNENKKQDIVSFVSRAQKNLLKGRETYQTLIDARRSTTAEKSKEGDVIKAMSIEDLRDYVTANGCNKYVWRRVGMSSLGEFRVLKETGQKRAGGSQGNYKAVLDTVSREYLFGDEDIARDLFSACRLLTSKYRNGEIQNNVYAEHICSIIETSEHTPSGFNAQKLFNQIVTTSYEWTHL